MESGNLVWHEGHPTGLDGRNEDMRDAIRVVRLTSQLGAEKSVDLLEGPQKTSFVEMIPHAIDRELRDLDDSLRWGTKNEERVKGGDIPS